MTKSRALGRARKDGQEKHEDKTEILPGSSRKGVLGWGDAILSETTEGTGEGPAGKDWVNPKSLVTSQGWFADGGRQAMVT